MRKVMLVTFLFVITGLYASAGKEMVSHQVQPHENLFRISLMYNSTVEDIVRANPGLAADKVRSGTVINVPQGTKIRDAAFVAALLHGKKAPVNNPDRATDLAQAQKIQDGLGENPFAAPKRSRKPIEQMEKEAALENNVPQRAFKATSTEAAPPAVISQQAAQAINPVRDIPTSLSVYDQFAALKSEDASSVKANAEAPSAGTATPVREMHPPMTETVESNNTMPENNAGTHITDPGNAGINAGDNHNAAILSQLQQLITGNQVIAINIQIVLKDGSVRTISTPDEQRKALSQLISEAAGR